MVELDSEKIRKDFPILKIKIKGKDFVYLDSAATSQKPKQVINAVSRYYKKYNSNIHRGIYEISERATQEYIDSKERTAKLIDAGSYRQIIYTRNTTESLNIVALSYANSVINEGDTILISQMEHHSNIVPWQMLVKKKKAKLDYIKLKDNAFLDLDDYQEKLKRKPKIISFTHVSNVLGTVNDAKEITRLGHDAGAAVVIDAAQSVPHMDVSVRDIDCDFLAFSSHKMLGPSGIGVLYAKEDLLEKMEPIYGGGDMIRSVEFQSSTWNELPWKFEAGTPNIEGGIGFGAAVKYLKKLGMGKVREHERKITEYALSKLKEIKGVRVYGPGLDRINEKAGVIAFSIDGIHAHDIASVFDGEGIAIRSGHHCAMPLVRGLLNEAAVSRMSFYVYNTEADVDRAVSAIGLAKKIFKK